jgi:hypothetical protein
LVSVFEWTGFHIQVHRLKNDDSQIRHQKIFFGLVF